ncbi:WavE lipopolysaccharide synthesis protein [Zymomonas mobilis]|nr:hypothetical protein ZZ6_0103 [Zymomonas mobilis subsp. mobilis ATCC 29191]TQK78561.1 WavE lipopolysaccharide synthesis protein [Zymomonas mobilis]TQL16234.1 WavE lipopolysaccharide synthesis protein [Zymomonas mobilis]GEB87446.1 hypothetical protein ZMO01_07860 [Zymomonas mobilis subsp. mobilis]
MISSLYTLNPYAEARLPFHYSDWFNFGKLSDIRPIWDIPFVTLDFMTYYLSHYYRPGSLEKERNFFSRMAVEQYIYFTFFSSHFKDIRLECHNDDSSIDESIQILLDNFIVVDLFNLNVYYPKYRDGFNSYTDNNTRIMQESWQYLSYYKDTNPSNFLHYFQDNLRNYKPKIFPLKIAAEQLFSKTGFHFGKSIIVSPDAPSGVACFGPYIVLDKGVYKASVAVSSLYPMQDSLKVKVSATAEEGNIVLNSEQFYFNKADEYKNQYTYLEICFSNRSNRLEKFEIVVSYEGKVDLAIDYINIIKL